MSTLMKLAIVLLVTLIGVTNTIYVVSEVERGIKLRFGEMVEVDIAPGLHIKVPFVDDVRLFDARILTVDAEPASFFTIEKKRLIVDSYAMSRPTTKRQMVLRGLRRIVWLNALMMDCEISLVPEHCTKWCLVSAIY